MRVFLVDAHPISREGLKHIMRDACDLMVVGETASCQNALERAGGDCDLFVLDGETDSLAFLQSLQKTRPKGRPPFTLVLTGRPEHRHAMQMLAAGANGYLDKSKPLQAILEAIRNVSRGGRSVSPEIAEKLQYNWDRQCRPARLSPREHQVLSLIASGYTPQTIAGQLSLSAKTVSTYRGRLLDKLNLRNNAELIRYALDEGITG